MITVSIDLAKIDKARIKITDKGQKFYNLVVDERKEPDTYGNTHTVYESQSKEERERKDKKNYIGNGKEYKFQNNNTQQPSAGYTPPAQSYNVPPSNGPVDDLPFKSPKFSREHI